MSSLRLATLAGDPEREAEFAADLAGRPQVELVLRCVDRLEALACIRGSSLDVLVAVGPVTWFDYQCVEEARRVGIRLVGHAADPIQAELLEIAGFRLIELEDSLQALADPQEEEVAPNRERPPGKVIAVWGPKGAPGRTTVAVELAATLAQTEPMTLLVDVDLYGGDVLQLLGIAEELPGVVPIARSGARGELRSDSWTAALKRSGNGSLLLPGLLRADLWSEVSPFGWQEVLEASRRDLTYSIFDVGFCLEGTHDPAAPAGRNDVARSTVAAADTVVATFRADAVGLRTFFWAIEAEPELLAPDRLVVVANRVRPGEDGEIKTIVRRQLGRFPIAFIPDRPDHMARAMWEASPLTDCLPASPIVEEIRRLAAAIGGRIEPRGFLSRLAGRRQHV